MQSVSANYTMPSILDTLTPAASSGTKKSAGAKANATTSSSSSAGGLGTTFLSLLSQELQNQDPTAPVDATAMVGQMISLNQLEQLITINQNLTSSTATAKGVEGATTSATALSSANGGVASALSPSVAGAATSQLPFDPKTMMPLTAGNSNAVAASFNTSLNAATMGLSGTNNNTNTSGGK
jgi:flagellar basal-body rod modification protein FlgD